MKVIFCCRSTKKLFKHRKAVHKLTQVPDEQHLILSAGEDGQVHLLTPYIWWRNLYLSRYCRIIMVSWHGATLFVSLFSCLHAYNPAINEKCYADFLIASSFSTLYWRRAALSLNSMHAPHRISGPWIGNTDHGAFSACSLSVADPGCLSRIPDPTFFHSGSRIRTVSIPDPHQRI